MMPPRITLGIPTYNRARLLKQALDSAIAQDHPNLEILVSDNASTDETPEVCAEAASRRSGVRILRKSENTGPNGNLENLLAHASGEYLLFLADDDYLAPNYVSSCLAALEEGAVLATGACRYYQQGKFVFEAPPVEAAEATGEERVLSYYRQVQDNYSWYGLARTRDWRETPLRMTIGIDWHMVASFAFRGPVRTVRSTTIHRDYSWSTDRIHGLGRLLGIYTPDPTRMYFWIGLLAAREIAAGTRFYRSLSLQRRLRLAGEAAAIVWNRHQVLETEGSRFMNRWLPSPAVKALRGARRLLQRAV
jgi:glycosyltransferase involved in cell wall biosynthesis